MNAPVEIENVRLRIGEAVITVPGDVAAMAYLEKLLEESRAIPIAVPRPTRPICSSGDGGKISGVTLFNGQLMELVLLPGELESGSHEDALAWAKEQGGVLPSRHDGIVLFENMKGEFKDAWYWLEPQRAGPSGYAWCQSFDDGDQYWDPRSSTYRARAVRRLPLQ